MVDTQATLELSRRSPGVVMHSEPSAMFTDFRDGVFVLTVDVAFAHRGDVCRRGVSLYVRVDEQGAASFFTSHEAAVGAGIQCPGSSESSECQELASSPEESQVVPSGCGTAPTVPLVSE